MIPAILRLLPLRSDFEPAISVHECIFNLLQAKHASIVNSADQITSIFVQELLTGALPNEKIRDQLVNFLKGVYNANKQSIDSTMEGMVQQGRASQENASQLHAQLNA